MGKFEFRGRNVELDIAGHKFTLSSDAELSQSLNRFSKEANELVGRDISEDEKRKEGQTICHKALDAILGGGAFDTISQVHSLDIVDCTDIVEYIADEVALHNEANKNRAQRRAAAKKGTKKG